MNCEEDQRQFFRDREHEPTSFKFKLIHESFAAIINRQLKEDDMTFSQLMLISYVWEKRNQKVTQKDISKALHIKHPTTIGLLKRLEEKEMLKVVVDPDNRKYRNIALTPKGEKFVKHNKERKRYTDSYLTEGMTTEEVTELRRLLDKVIDNMKELREETMNCDDLNKSE
ncbi:MarR family transcriptional regulator [Butyrivibrio sp. DSM 10294]|uniref:MarR family winged helix-turn-helix transcriptional regulator n=1 Tax=Butyrivibrio sp. DSM 10294 TaxID=2972457 RepID=UPI00234EB136|nr:MarR family transcriptional regulator [Butyrivibrio sp. DSM 10294]MDC7294397.1 MarR family transcriptional regulator [Butyrivibrio sp. DSM 10294]